MGWLYTHKPRGVTATDFLINHSGALTWSSEEREWDYKVLDSAIVKLRTFYAAVEMVHRKTGERRVWAAVFLLGYASKSHHNFGYKDLSEDMGPCESECPERILKLLTPTDSEYANEWRKRCWDRINFLKNRGKIEPGCDIVLHGKTYKVTQSVGHRGFHIRRVEDGAVYRLSIARARDVTEVIPKEKV